MPLLGDLSGTSRPWRCGASVATACTGVATLMVMAAPADGAIPCGSFGAVHRFDDDFACLADPSNRRGANRGKYVGLPAGASVVFGGELRERLESTDRPRFGLGVVRSETALLHRLLLHADLRLPAGPRLFVQLGRHRAAGREPGPRPTDEDSLDLQQSFVEFPLQRGVRPATLRVGRQELAFGSQRLTTTRDGTNLRLAFDGARLSWRAGDALQVDAFAARPVRRSRGAFDDTADTGESFRGIHATFTGHYGFTRTVEAYWFGIDRDDARFDRAAGRERRQTTGLRIAGSRAAWDWDWEAAAQWGRFDDRPIRAWTLATSTARTFAQAPASPRAGVKIDYASGSPGPGAAALGTFNPLYPRAPYFSEAALIAPANLFDVHPFIELHTLPGLTTTVSIDALWRARTADAFYAQPLAPLVGGVASRARYVGTQAELKVAWQLHRNVTATATYVRFHAGSVLRDAGGRSLQFGGLWVTVRY